jgi:Ulp1 family protease
MQKEMQCGNKPSGKKAGQPKKSTQPAKKTIPSGKTPGRPKKLVAAVKKTSAKKAGRPKKSVEPAAKKIDPPKKVNPKPAVDVIDVTSDDDDVIVIDDDDDDVTVSDAPAFIDLKKNLTQRQIQHVNDIFNKTADEGKKIIKIIDSVELSVNDFKKLQPTPDDDDTTSAWLNDNIITSWIKTIDKSETNFLFTVDSIRHLFDTEKMKRFIKKQKKQLFDVEKILIPYNLGNNHWVLIVIYPKEKQIGFFDSLYAADMALVKKIKNLFMELARDPAINKSQIITEKDVSQWKINKSLKSAKQVNAKDCGVFLCANMFYINLNQKPSFAQKDIPNIRYRIAYDLSKAT